MLAGPSSEKPDEAVEGRLGVTFVEGAPLFRKSLHLLNYRCGVWSITLSIAIPAAVVNGLAWLRSEILAGSR